MLAHWTGERRYVSYVNARSAFAALVDLLEPELVWVPAYTCADFVASTWRGKVRFYHVGRNLEADLSELKREAIPGDLVVGVNYFGYPIGSALTGLRATRRDLFFVEDRAQALAPSKDFWGDWCLYSPRKLLGVADGGILIASADQPLPTCSEAPNAVQLWTAPLLRYEDCSETENEIWYAAHRAKEAQMSVSQQRMTELSKWILSRSSIDRLVDCRRRNWRVLQDYLGRWLAFEHDCMVAPLGFVIEVPAMKRAKLLHTLHSEGIFASVHWPLLASASEDFPREHDLCSRLITLPCDHRYDQGDMRILASRVSALLG